MEKMGLYNVQFFDKAGEDIYLDMNVHFKGMFMGTLDGFETITEAVEFGKEMIKTLEPLAGATKFMVCEDWTHTPDVGIIDGDYIEIQLNKNIEKGLFYLMDNEGDCWAYSDDKGRLKRLLWEISDDEMMEKYDLKIVKGN